MDFSMLSVVQLSICDTIAPGVQIMSADYQRPVPLNTTHISNRSFYLQAFTDTDTYPGLGSVVSATSAYTAADHLAHTRLDGTSQVA